LQIYVLCLFDIIKYNHNKYLWGSKMSLFLCTILALFMGFSYGTLLFIKYQTVIEKDLISVSVALGKKKKEIPENL